MAIAIDVGSTKFEQLKLMYGMVLFPLVSLGGLLVDLAREYRGSPGRLPGYGVVIVLVAIYGLMLPAGAHDPDLLPSAFWIQYGMLLFVIHLALALIPTYGGMGSAQLWRFNAEIFLRYIFAVINVIILYLGLTLALVSMNKLFNLDFDEEIYGQLWVLCTFFVHPLLFLAGVPGREQLDVSKPFPKALRFTLKFIALPLVALYFVILYLYAGKILVTMSWPDGWVALPVYVLSATAVLTYLLSIPLREEEGWAGALHRWAFPLLLPLSVLLLLAMEERIGAYGFTVPRYLGVLLGVWLLGLSAVYVFRRKQTPSVFWLPFSLMLVVLVALIGGPISANSVSVRSQLSRLEQMLEDAGGVKDGQWVKLPEKVSGEVNGEIRSKVDYLTQWHGGESIADRLVEFFNDKGITKPEFLKMRSWSQESEVLSYLGIDTSWTSDYQTYDLGYEGYPLFGHSYAMRQSLYLGQARSSYERTLNTSHGTIKIEGEETFLFYHEDKLIGELNPTTFVEQAFDERGEPVDRSTIVSATLEGAGWRITLIATSLTIKRDSREFNRGDFLVLYTPPSE